VYKSWDYSTIFFVSVFVSLLASALTFFLLAVPIVVKLSLRTSADVVGSAPCCDDVAAYECAIDISQTTTASCRFSDERPELGVWDLESDVYSNAGTRFRITL
jgi:hypothetical protein